MITSNTAPEVLKRAVPHVARIKANYAQHEADVRRYGWSNECRHGTNIGNPYGADLMCGYCEDAIPMEIYWFAIAAAKREIEAEEAPRRRIEMLYGLLLEHPQYRTFINAELSRRA